MLSHPSPPGISYDIIHKYTCTGNIAQMYQNFNYRKYDGFLVIEAKNKIDDTGKGSAGWAPPPLVLGLMFTLNTRAEYRTVAHEVDTVSSL